MLREHLKSVSYSLIYRLHTFILIPLIVGALGFEALGEYILIFAICGQILSLSNMGYGFSYKVEFSDLNANIDRKRMFYQQFYLGLIILLLISLAALVYFYHIGNLHYTNQEIIIYILVLIVMYFFNQVVSFYRYSGRPVEAARISLLAVSVFIFSVYVLSFYSQFKSTSDLFLVYLMVYLAFVLVLFGSIIKEIGVQYCLYTKQELYKDVKNSFHYSFKGTLEQFYLSLDKYMISFIFGTSILGEYVAIKTVASLPLMLFTSSSTSLFSLLIKRYNISKKFDEGSRAYALFVGEILLYVSILFIFGAGYYGELVIETWLNKEVPLLSDNLLIVLIAISSILYGQFILKSEVFNVCRDTKKPLLSLIVMVLSTILIWYIVSLFSNSLELFVSLGALCIVIGMLNMRLDALNLVIFPQKEVYKMILAGIVMSLINYYFLNINNASLFELMMYMAISVLVYFSTTYFLGVGFFDTLKKRVNVK